MTLMITLCYMNKKKNPGNYKSELKTEIYRTYTRHFISLSPLKCK